MRVRRTLRSVRADERGVVAPIVVICMIAIFAMVVLTIDVGNLLYERRKMVNAADAAALAAAQTCADSDDTSDPRDVADRFAEDNVPEATRVSYEDPGCGTGEGHVSVVYTEPKGLFFAPVLGLGRNSTITTKATAEWVPGGSTNPVPFVVQSSTFQSGNCDLPDLPIDTVCHFWEDNGGGGAGGFGGSAFGFIDVNPDSWNVTDPNSCNGNPDKNSLRDYAAAGGYNGSTPLPALNYPDPTWACGVNGLTTPTFEALAENKGEILAFPVVDDNIITQGSFVKAWNVIGFVQMELVDVIRAKDGASGGSEGSCAVTIPQPGATNGTSYTLSLMGSMSGASDCPNSNAALDEVTQLELRGCQTTTSLCTVGTDYTLTPSSGVPLQITFKRDMPHPVKVSFGWKYFGVCGEPASNNSGYCFVLKWKGVQLGNAPGGANFGLVKVRLCDPALADSCETTA